MDLYSLMFAVLVSALAAGTDLRTGRIPNVLTYSAVVAGLCLGLTPEAQPALSARVVGLITAFLPAAALFAAGSVGGGDVKLLAAMGAVVGYPLILDVLFYTILVGAAISLGIIIWKGRSSEAVRGFGRLIASLPAKGVPKVVPLTDLRVPFGPAVLAGTVWTIVAPSLRISARLVGPV
jgi:prepilin peptidase CpaA